MSWISHIFTIIVTTSATGTLSFVLWMLLLEQFARRGAYLTYLTLRLVCLLYFVPVGYVCLLLTSGNGLFQSDGVWQTHFLLTGFLWMAFLVLLVFWLALTAQNIVVYIWKNSWRRLIYGGNIPEEDAVAEEEFARIRRKLNIRRKIRLCRNDMLDTPQMYGILRPRVILPYRNYTRRELIVIFHHELMHYKSRDVFYKWCVLCVQMTHHLNPFAGRLERELGEWSEYCCDLRAIDAIADEMSAGEYFDVIVRVAGRQQTEVVQTYAFSGLCDGQLKLERRIDNMKRYHGMNGPAKAGSALIAFLFAATSVTTVYAAGAQLSSVHDSLYEFAEPQVRETATVQEMPKLQEHYLPAEEDEFDELVYIQQEPRDLFGPEENEQIEIDWNIRPGSRYITDTFKVEKGQSIHVAVVLNPNDAYCWVGIMDPWNSVRYVDGYWTLSHEFEIVYSGRYRVFVQNKEKEGEVHAVGFYYFATPAPEETEEPGTEEP